MWTRVSNWRFKVNDAGALVPPTAEQHNCESDADRLWVRGGPSPAAAEFARLPDLPYNVHSKGSRAWALLQGPVGAPAYHPEAPFNVQDSELSQARLRGAVLNPEWDPHGGANYVSGPTRHSFSGPLHAITEAASADPVPTLRGLPGVLGNVLLPPLLTVIHTSEHAWHLASGVLPPIQCKAFRFLLQPDVAGYLEPRLAATVLDDDHDPDSVGALVGMCAAFSSRCRTGATALAMDRMRVLRVPVAQRVVDDLWALMTHDAVSNVQAILQHVPALSFIGFGDTPVSAATVDGSTGLVALSPALGTSVPEGMGGKGQWADGALTTHGRLVPLVDTPNMVVQSRLYRAVGMESRPMLPSGGEAGVAPTVMEAGKLEVWAVGLVASPQYDLTTCPWLRWNRIKQDPDGTVTRKLCAGAVGRGATYAPFPRGNCQVKRGTLVSTRTLQGAIAKGTFVEGGDAANLTVTDVPVHGRKTILRASMHGTANAPVCDIMHLATLTLCKGGTPRLSVTTRLSGPPACPTFEPLDLEGHDHVFMEQHRSTCRVRCPVKFNGDKVVMDATLVRMGNTFMEMDVRVRQSSMGLPRLDWKAGNVTLVAVHGRPDLAHLSVSLDAHNLQVLDTEDVLERLRGPPPLHQAVHILVKKGLKLLAKGLVKGLPEVLRLLRACRFGPYVLSPALAPTLHQPSVVTRDGTRMWLAAGPDSVPGQAHFVWRVKGADALPLPLTSSRELMPIETSFSLPNAILADGTKLWFASTAAVRVATVEAEARIVPRDDMNQTLTTPLGERLWVVSGPGGALHFGPRGSRDHPEFTFWTQEEMVALAGPVSSPRTHAAAPWTVRNRQDTVRMACPRGVPWQGANTPLEDPRLGPNVRLREKGAVGFALTLWATGTLASFCPSSTLQPNACIIAAGWGTCYCTLTMQTLPGGRLVFSFASAASSTPPAPPEGALAMPPSRNVVDGSGQAAALQGVCAMAIPTAHHGGTDGRVRAFFRVSRLELFSHQQNWRFDPVVVGPGNYTHVDGRTSVLQGSVTTAWCAAPDFFKEGVHLVHGFPPWEAPWWKKEAGRETRLLHAASLADFRQAWPEMTRLAVSQHETPTCVVGGALNMFLCNPLLVAYMRHVQRWSPSMKTLPLDDVPAETAPLQDALYFIFNQAHVAAVGGASNPLVAKWLPDTTVHVDANLRHKLQAGVDPVATAADTLGGALPSRTKIRPAYFFETATLWTMIAALSGSGTWVLPEALWDCNDGTHVEAALGDLALPYCVKRFSDSDVRSVPTSLSRWDDEVEYELVGASVLVMPSGGLAGHVVAGVLRDDGRPCMIDSNLYVHLHDWVKNLGFSGRVVGDRYGSTMPSPYNVTCLALYLESSLVAALRGKAAFDAASTACEVSVDRDVTILVQAAEGPGQPPPAEPDLRPGVVLPCAKETMPPARAPLLVPGLDLFNCTWGQTRYKCKDRFKGRDTKLASGWGPAPTVKRTCPDGSEEYMWAWGTIGHPEYEYVGAWNWQRAPKAGAAPRWFRALRTGYKEGSKRAEYFKTERDFAVKDLHHVNAMAVCPSDNRVWAFAMQPKTEPKHGVLRNTADFNAKVTFKGKVEAQALLATTMTPAEAFEVARGKVQDLRMAVFLSLWSSAHDDARAVNKIKIEIQGAKCTIVMDCDADDDTWIVVVVTKHRRLHCTARTLQDVMHRHFDSAFVAQDLEDAEDAKDARANSVYMPFLVNDDYCWRFCEEVMHYVLSECVPQGCLAPSVQPFVAGLDMRA